MCMQGDKKAKGSIKLIPGSFNLQSQHGQGKADRDFPLTVLIEVPDRDSVRMHKSCCVQTDAYLTVRHDRRCDWRLITSEKPAAGWTRCSLWSRHELVLQGATGALAHRQKVHP